MRWKNNGISLPGLSETRWQQLGQTKLSFGEVVLHSGHEKDNAPHTEGADLILSERRSKLLLVGKQ